MKFLFVFFIIINNIILSKKENKLIFVELQSRHGARSPLKLNDKNKDLIGAKWENVGELTGVGQRMEYLLGLRNRYRYITNTYKSFLSNKFDPHELLVYSTSLNRTLLSMTSQLQGLYPISSKKGDILINDDQINHSTPEISYSCDEINNEINRIENSSLPDYMTIIPIHTISPSEKKIAVYDFQDCKPKVEKITNNNCNENEPLIDLVKNFRDKYSQNLTGILPKNFEYNVDNISAICDSIIVDSTEGKPMEDFFDKTHFNKTVLIEYCKNVLKTNFRFKLFGDKNREILLLEESSILREMIHYMKQRVDADIIGEKIEDNITDYSRPKMVIISGHDTTLSAQLIFMIIYFNLSEDLYELPEYSAQTAFEVTRDVDIQKEKLDYSDYIVNFYYNENLLLNITMNKFIEIVESKTWTIEKIDKFCYGDNSKIIMTIILIGISVFTLILLIIIIILIIKIGKKSNNTLDNSSDSDNL